MYFSTHKSRQKVKERSLRWGFISFLRYIVWIVWIISVIWISVIVLNIILSFHHIVINCFTAFKELFKDFSFFFWKCSHTFGLPHSGNHSSKLRISRAKPKYYSISFSFFYKFHKLRSSHIIKSAHSLGIYFLGNQSKVRIFFYPSIISRTGNSCFFWNKRNDRGFSHLF